MVIDTMALDGPGTSGALRELLQRDAYVVANANLTEALPARGGSESTKWNGFSSRPTRPHVMT